MKTTERNEAVLPSGSWLAQERQRLGKTLVDVAKAVQGHHATIRAVEQNNRVLPPGWHTSLRKLGMYIYVPLWPAQMQPYGGADLKADLQTRTGFRHSPYWLSKQLCVTESLVTEIIRDNLLVPHSWLLKLAELGANVPTEVQETFRRRVSEIRVLRIAAPPADVDGPNSLEAALKQLTQKRKTAPQAFEAHALGDPNLQPKESFGPALLEQPAPSNALPLDMPPDAADKPGPESVRREAASIFMRWTEERGLHFSVSAPLLATSLKMTQASTEGAGPASDRREPSSIFMHWTEDAGLHFNVSAPLLTTLPLVLQEILSQLAQSNLRIPQPGPGASAART